jgi:hypothetical protein
MDVCNINVRHQAIGQNRGPHNWPNRNPCATCEPLCQLDAGDQHVLFHRMPCNGLNESRKPCVVRVLLGCQANMPNFHKQLDKGCGKNQSPESNHV